MTEENNYAPLKGIKVVDWTQVQSGPSCTQLLAWLGADVIKIERTNTGDPTRNELLDIQDSWSLYYLQLNANKKSLTLNIKTDEGKKIMYDLIKKADVFVENIAPGSAERNGFGWKKLHAMNPKLIYASLKGFNEGSRFEDVKAFEQVAQSAGGGASATSWNEGKANVPTQSTALGDSNSGMHLTIGILAALLQREHTGEGAFVYQSMQDAVLNLCRIKLSVGLTRLKVGKLILTLMFTSLFKTATRAGQQLPTPWVTQNGLLILALMAGKTANYTRKKFIH
ncbi:Formyl-CoA:oxalate CoA-transferase [Lactobacillus helveticus]|nr:Formyl-CoA:oxalate CoA-transferase [Lactobacillus helveticus]NRO09488.1 Formyl-CoA:oxalate CoA-transferase [Lactobacillus helveticus]NRO65510.1 Formyl-CoA:oxalate CoA-transferase [Lactobacillus helveticus]